LFLPSAFLFRMGLLLITFEQVRPFFGMQVSDYCFFLSLFLLLPQPGLLRLSATQTRLLLGCWVILIGSVLSLVNASSLGDAAGPLMRFFVLFALFAPLSMIHAKEMRRNCLYLLAGIFANSVITLLQATIFPTIADVLSINPTRPDISDIGRFQGLTSHPNIIGLCAGFAGLIGIGLLFSDGNRHLRVRLTIAVIICSLAGLLSGSRAVLVSLIPGLLVLALVQKQRHRLGIRIAIAAAIVWGLATYMVPSVVSQFGERLDASGSDIYSDYGRLWSAVYAVVEITQKPIIGWGIDHLDDAGLVEVPWTGEVVGAHN